MPAALIFNKQCEMVSLIERKLHARGGTAALLGSGMRLRGQRPLGSISQHERIHAQLCRTCPQPGGGGGSVEYAVAGVAYNST